MTLSEAVLDAAETLRAPGQEAWRVVSPVKVGEIAGEHGRPRWEVEVAALEAGVVPLHYMRNIARFGLGGQVELLRTTVAVVGAGAVVATCLQRLAGSGLGRIRLLTPVDLPAPDPAAVAGLVAKMNASTEAAVGAIDLRRGDPTVLLRGTEIVAACLEDAGDEFLLQTACRRLELPLVCAGIGENQGQATVILPGDATLTRVYRPDHPHLERARPVSSQFAGQAALMVGTWMADQVLAARLRTDDLLRHRLLFADIRAGQIETFDLG